MDTYLPTAKEDIPKFRVRLKPERKSLCGLSDGVDIWEARIRDRNVSPR